MSDDPFAAAKFRLPDGRVAYDAVALASIPTEGVFLKDVVGKIVFVQTQNTIYRLEVQHEYKVIGRAYKIDGSTPEFLPFDMPVIIHGSTWGGSMLKIMYIGVNMHLQFSTYEDGSHTVTTTAIQNIRLAPKV